MHVKPDCENKQLVSKDSFYIPHLLLIGFIPQIHWSALHIKHHKDHVYIVGVSPLLATPQTIVLIALFFASGSLYPSTD